jgi:hypothetical protein
VGLAAPVKAARLQSKTPAQPTNGTTSAASLCREGVVLANTIVAKTKFMYFAINHFGCLRTTHAAPAYLERLDDVAADREAMRTAPKNRFFT